MHRSVLMSNISENEILSPFISKAVNHEELNSLGELHHGAEYIICNRRYMDDPQLRELFGVTERLKEQWEYSGVDFNLYLTIDGNTIVKARLDKYRELGGGHGRPVVRPLKETQQELRIARRILEYLTK